MSSKKRRIKKRIRIFTCMIIQINSDSMRRKTEILYKGQPLSRADIFLNTCYRPVLNKLSRRKDGSGGMHIRAKEAYTDTFVFLRRIGKFH